MTRLPTVTCHLQAAAAEKVEENVDSVSDDAINMYPPSYRRQQCSCVDFCNCKMAHFKGLLKEIDLRFNVLRVRLSRLIKFLDNRLSDLNITKVERSPSNPPIFVI